MTREELALFMAEGSHEKIVGGVVALPHEFPWLVSLEYYGHYYCGGALLSDRLVLTAAHCIQPHFPVYVRLGDHDKYSDDPATELVGATPVLHPDYGRKGKSLGSDLAMLWLHKRVDIPAHQGRIAPICLPKVGSSSPSLVVAAGWGLTSEGGSQARILQKADLITMSNEECFNSTGYAAIPEYMDATMLCAQAQGKDSCSGDSGGPLITLDQGRSRWTLKGVISWGVGCGRAEYPGIYQRVFHNIQWIERQLAESKSNMCRDS